MGTPRVKALTNALSIIRAIYPAHTSKHLQRHWGVSEWQAARVLKTGRLPSTIAEVALAALEQEAKRRRENIARIEDELKAIRYARMVARAEARRQSSGAESGQSVDGNDSGTTLPFVKR